MAFSFDQFVEDVRSAAQQPDPDHAIRALLAVTVADPDPIIAATATDGDDEINLYEDDHLSIWRCRFQPDVVMPPHEHRVTVHIAGYAGGEKNILFRPKDGELHHVGTETVAPGDVISLDEECIHAVTATGSSPSLTLHVYRGPLMQLKRDLFDWQTGEAVQFTMENFDRMKRPAAELPTY